MTRSDSERRVRLHPTGDAFIPGVKAVERLVPADIADVLLAHTPAAFTREKDGDLAEDPHEDLSDIYDALPALNPDQPPETLALSEGATGAEEVTDNG